MSQHAPVHIAIDARVLQGEDARRGMGNYTRGLVRSLVAVAPEEALEITLLAEEGPAVPDLDVSGISRVLHVTSDRRQGGLLRRHRDAVGLVAAAREAGADVLHVSSPLHGPYHWLPARGMATVAVVYDLIPWLQRERFIDQWPAVARRRYLRRMHRLSRLDGVLAISSAVAHDVEELARLGSGRVCLAAPGVGEAFQRRRRVAASDRAFHVIAFASGNPSKNLPCLLEAYGHLASGYAGARCPGLVLVGADTAALRRAVFAALPESARSRVEYLAAPDDSTLADRMAESLALVLPSTAEGFGLPALEAMSLGTPVVASDIEVLREVLGSSATYFDPHDARGLADAVAGLVWDVETRERHGAEGQRRAEGFRWEQTARRVADAYRRWRRARVD